MRRWLTAVAIAAVFAVVPAAQAVAGVEPDTYHDISTRAEWSVPGTYHDV